MPTSVQTERHTAYMRGWRQRNRDRANAHSNLGRARWLARNPDAARLLRRVDKTNQRAKRYGAGSISMADLRAIEERDAGRCAFCRMPTKEIDHGIPMSRGGPNRRDNLQLCCRACNLRKGRMTTAEFRGEVTATCPNGHPRTAEHRRLDARGVSICVTCKADRDRAYRARPEVRDRIEARRRERLRTDSVARERDRAYKRAWWRRHRELETGDR